MTLLRQGKYELIPETGEVGSDKCQQIFIFIYDSKYSSVDLFRVFFFFIVRECNWNSFWIK